MKHEIYELKQMQSLPLKSKITMTMKRIIDWKEYWESKGESVYVSWSGGKDSTVLLHIAKQLYPDITRVYVDTGLEYPEIKEFIKKDKDVVILHPTKPFWKVVTEYGYPVISKEVSECIDQSRKALKSDKYNYRLLKIKGEAKQKNGEKSKYNLAKYKPLLNVPFKISSKCCSIMKKSPLHKYNHKNKTHPMTAEMACESRLRTQQWLKNGCNGFDMKEPKSTPMSFWTEQDVLEYIKKYNVEIASVYGEVINDTNLVDGFEQLAFCEEVCKYKTSGATRTGCVFCLYGCHLEKGLSRFQKLKQTHPQLYNYCISGGEFNEEGLWQPNQNGLGLGFVMDTINKIYGQDFLRYK